MKKLLVLMCAFVAVVTFSSCSSPKPSDVVKSYYTAVQKGDMEKALTYVKAENKEENQAQLTKLQGFGIKIIDFEIISENISENGNEAEVKVKCSYSTSFNEEKKEESTPTVKLEKVDKKWMIVE